MSTPRLCRPSSALEASKPRPWPAGLKDWGRERWLWVQKALAGLRRQRRNQKPLEMRGKEGTPGRQAGRQAQGLCPGGS